MRFSGYLVFCLAVAGIAGALGVGRIDAYAAGRTTSPPIVAQEASYEDAAKAFTEAVEAKEFKKLPKLSMALAKAKKPAGILLMIGAIDSEGTSNTIYNVGFFGLAEITGVKYEETHDGRWWRGWWGENKSHYPADVQNAEIPQFKGFTATPHITIPDSSDVASIPSKAYYADGDRDKLYIVSGGAGAAPEGGYRVLVVLPGGDGSIDFHPFVKRIQLNCLADRYIVAELVAPRFGSSQTVWPTKGSPVAGMKFGTEEFIESVITEVKKNYKVNSKYVFTLGWSSSGPPLYVHMTSKPRSTTGAFVAMSVYHPSEMGPLDSLRGFPVYILHSPDDKVCPIILAEQARGALSAAGATVGYATYPGGHGWSGDVYGNISAGIQFLEANAGR